VEVDKDLFNCLKSVGCVYHAWRDVLGGVATYSAFSVSNLRFLSRIVVGVGLQLVLHPREPNSYTLALEIRKGGRPVAWLTPQVLPP
jgi:hypothetical protein